MSKSVLIAVLSSVVIGVLGWVAAISRGRVRDRLDRRRVHRWLRSQTRDEPGESHVDIPTVAKGTGLPEDRVRRACVSDQRIQRFSGSSEQWSVWRKEPQSVYEKRGLLVL